MELKQAIEHRRSVNFFDSQKTITEDTITKILDLAATAPSTMNLQPWKTVTVLSPEKKEILKTAAMNQPKVTEASCVIIILADKEFIEDNLDVIADNQKSTGAFTDEACDKYTSMAKGGHGEQGTDLRRKKAIVSTGLFAMNLMYAAASFGYDTHSIGGFSEDAVKKSFDIPEKYEPVMLLAVGNLRQDVTLYPRAYRIPADKFNKII